MLYCSKILFRPECRATWRLKKLFSASFLYVSCCICNSVVRKNLRRRNAPTGLQDNQITRLNYF
jgi:hypothetical protein